MKYTKSLYHVYRFPPEIISRAVWLYYRFYLSYRDIEDFLAERGIRVLMNQSGNGVANVNGKCVRSNQWGKLNGLKVV